MQVFNNLFREELKKDDKVAKLAGELFDKYNYYHSRYLNVVLMKQDISEILNHYINLLIKDNLGIGEYLHEFILYMFEDEKIPIRDYLYESEPGTKTISDKIFYLMSGTDIIQSYVREYIYNSDFDMSYEIYDLLKVVHNVTSNKFCHMTLEPHLIPDLANIVIEYSKPSNHKEKKKKKVVADSDYDSKPSNHKEKKKKKVVADSDYDSDSWVDTLEIISKCKKYEVYLLEEECDVYDEEGYYLGDWRKVSDKNALFTNKSDNYAVCNDFMTLGQECHQCIYTNKQYDKSGKII